jgi:hypothetical protein
MDQQHQEFPKRKIAIVGWAGTSRDLAPWTDDSWEKWVLNTMAQRDNYAANCSRVFQLHSKSDIARDQTDEPDHWKFLTTNTTIPVYMHEHIAESWISDGMGNVVAFPTRALLDKFPNYFTNTVSWMIALAIHEGADVIGLWGVDMAHAISEYGEQRPSCEFYLGLAMGRGIEVHVAPESDLLKTPGQYGLTEDTPMYTSLTARQAEMTDRLGQSVAAQNQNVQIIAQLQGRVAEATEQERTDRAAALNADLQAAMTTQNNCAMAIANLQGGLEIVRYMINTWALPQTRLQESA